MGHHLVAEHEQLPDVGLPQPQTRIRRHGMKQRGGSTLGAPRTTSTHDGGVTLAPTMMLHSSSVSDSTKPPSTKRAAILWGCALSELSTSWGGGGAAAGAATTATSWAKPLLSKGALPPHTSSTHLRGGTTAGGTAALATRARAAALTANMCNTSEKTNPCLIHKDNNNTQLKNKVEQMSVIHTCNHKKGLLQCR